MTKDRSIVNWTPDQYKLLQKVAEAIGQTVPQYCRSAALEKARLINGKDA